jgi:hypothetical protein
MTTRMEFDLESGGTVIVESAGASGVGPAGRVDKAAQKAGRTLRESLGSVVEAAEDIMEAFKALPRMPEEIEVQFGVSLDASVNAVIASSTGNAHLDVTLRWIPGAAPDVS